MRIAVIAALAGASLLVSPNSGRAQTLSDQIQQGRDLFARGCVDCHGSDLLGTDRGFALKGPTFMRVWEGERAGRLFDRVHEAPELGQGSLSAAERVNLSVYLMDQNDIAASPGFAVDVGLLTGVPLLVSEEEPEPVPDRRPAQPKPSAESAEAPSSSSSSVAPPVRSRLAWRGVVDGYAMVTESTLAAPPPEDWLHWRGTPGNTGYSGLSEITPTNAPGLRMAWSWGFPSGAVNPSALARGGVVFLSSDGGSVVAIQGNTGHVIWGTGPLSETTGPVVSSSLAIYRDKIFLTLSTGETIALRAADGAEVWRTGTIVDGLAAPVAPIVSGGRVVVPAPECGGLLVSCSVSGHDPATGAEVWRTNVSTLEPGDPEKIVAPAAHDGSSGVTYWTVHPTNRSSSPGDSAIVWNRVLAVSSEDGSILWERRSSVGHVADLVDLGSSLLVQGEDGAELLSIAETGFLWAFDVEDGSYMDHHVMLPQNIVDEVESGRPRVRQDILDADSTTWVPLCPGPGGGVVPGGLSFAEDQGMLVAATNLLCAEVRWGEDRVDRRWFEHPASQGNLGRLIGVDKESKQLLWSADQRAGFTTGVLATAGGLAFVGDADRYFRAHDLRTGAVVWETRLPMAPHGNPISFRSGDREFVAVLAVAGEADRDRGMRLLTPEIRQATEGQGVFVFALPPR